MPLPAVIQGVAGQQRMGGQSVGDPKRWGRGGVNIGRKEPWAWQFVKEPELRRRGGVNSKRKELGAWRSVVLRFGISGVRRKQL